MYSSYQAGVSPEGGLEVGQTLWFFQKPLACKQALLFGRVKRVSRERASVPRSCVLARLTRRASSQAKKPFARKLIYSGAKWRFIEQYVYWNLIQDKKIFGLWRDILNAHFYKYAMKVVYQLDFLKMNLLHKSKMKCFTSRCCLRTWGK